MNLHELVRLVRGLHPKACGGIHCFGIRATEPAIVRTFRFRSCGLHAPSCLLDELDLAAHQATGSIY
jgi:hypothetical protein